MKDERLEKLADVLVNYSTKVKKVTALLFPQRMRHCRLSRQSQGRQ